MVRNQDASYARDDTGAKVSAIDMHGCSGGAIIDMARISLESLEKGFDPKLTALFIEGHAQQKVILGTRVSAILAGVRRHRKK